MLTTDQPCLLQDLVRALLSRDAIGRLGCGIGGGAAIKAHPFLSSVDWEALHRGEATCITLDVSCCITCLQCCRCTSVNRLGLGNYAVPVSTQKIQC